MFHASQWKYHVCFISCTNTGTWNRFLSLDNFNFNWIIVYSFIAQESYSVKPWLMFTYFPLRTWLYISAYCFTWWDLISPFPFPSLPTLFLSFYSFFLSSSSCSLFLFPHSAFLPSEEDFWVVWLTSSW